MEMSNNFAYFLGVIAGDGYVSKRGQIEIKSDNYEFLIVYSKIVKNLINKRVNVVKETNNCGSTYYRACFYSKQFTSTVLNPLDMISPKTFTVSIPSIIKNSEIKYKLDFVRGVFDTDGSIFTRVDKKIQNYPNLSLNSRSKKLIEGINEILIETGLNSHMIAFMDKGKPRYFIRLYGFHELYKYMNLIGFYNPPKSERAKRILVSGIIRSK